MEQEKTKKEYSSLRLLLTTQLQDESIRACQEIGYDKSKILLALLMYVVENRRLPQDLIPYVMHLEATGKRSMRSIQMNERRRNLDTFKESR